MIGLLLHAAVYVGANAFLAFAPIEAAPLLPLAGWGVVLAAHAVHAAAAGGQRLDVPR